MPLWSQQDADSLLLLPAPAECSRPNSPKRGNTLPPGHPCWCSSIRRLGSGVSLLLRDLPPKSVTSSRRRTAVTDPHRRSFTFLPWLLLLRSRYLHAYILFLASPICPSFVLLWDSCLFVCLFSFISTLRLSPISFFQVRQDYCSGSSSLVAPSVLLVGLPSPPGLPLTRPRLQGWHVDRRLSTVPNPFVPPFFPSAAFGHV